MRTTCLEQLSARKLARLIVGNVPGLEVSAKVRVGSVFRVVDGRNGFGLRSGRTRKKLSLGEDVGRSIEIDLEAYVREEE
jgi:hypothetical protein